jgi:hypothetical protein
MYTGSLALLLFYNRLKLFYSMDKTINLRIYEVPIFNSSFFLAYYVSLGFTLKIIEPYNT